MRHDIEEIVDSKISIHDSRHFEIKLNVDVPDSRKTTYEIETYFFVPRSLNIGPTTYSQADFYSGIQKYIRFKTPEISLDRITDPSVPASPWNRISARMNALLTGSLSHTEEKKAVSALVEEIKLLGQVIRASLRDSTILLLKEIDSLRDKGDEGGESKRIEAAHAGLARLIQEAKSLEIAIGQRRGEFQRPQVPKRVNEAFRFFDEFFSLIVEEYFSLLLKTLESVSGFEDLRDKIGDELASQQVHRRAMGFPSLIQKGKDNSIIPYRKGVLKKFSSSSLYLSLEPSEWHAVSQFTFSIAAGVAMLFAAVVTVFAQSRFSTSSSIFVMIVVLSYMLKDRMKDWLKVFLSKRMLRGAADQRAKIRDPGTDQVVGVFREAFSFMEVSIVPDLVRSRRNIDNITSIDEEGKPERVMKYEKQVTLYPRKIAKFHRRRRDINDIMRFDVSQWVKNADDPATEVLHFDPETRKLETVSCSKLYHLNILFRCRTAGAIDHTRDTFERIRLVVSRDGIVQLEEVR